LIREFESCFLFFQYFSAKRAFSGLENKEKSEKEPTIENEPGMSWRIRLEDDAIELE
jgi:hypothetical protein